MNNGNQPINPVMGANNVPFVNDGFLESRSMMTGLTKREHFAGLAMQGLLLGINAQTGGEWHNWSEEDFSEAAVKQADSLLKMLDK